MNGIGEGDLVRVRSQRHRRFVEADTALEEVGRRLVFVLFEVSRDDPPHAHNMGLRPWAVKGPR